eukprot:Nk52_evm36s370 gene=Nk52_evmTU36s370
MDISKVPDRFDFPGEELKTLERWEKNKSFETCLKMSEGKKRYTFYDGPPFATGLPHYGHLLISSIKDTVTRYWHQNGYHVERRFGWDTHGVPIEFEIDKKLGMSGKEAVEKLGIAGYNAECRAIVDKYADEWRETVSRIGRWIDFDNDYKTMYPWYMESVWYIFKEIFQKGLVYRGYKVMPFSTGCGTPLSNFEANSNYKDVSDPAVFVSFKLVDEPDVCLIAWTTTPWTLPSNLALCVNPNSIYVKVKDNKTEKIYIMMKVRIPALFPKGKGCTILEEFTGDKLAGLKYEPLFQYFYERKKNEAFRVLTDGYVGEDAGTGIVHQAPAFGEDDFRVCVEHGVIRKDDEAICPVDDSGKFTAEVTDFSGMYVKDADKLILKKLKEEGRVVQSGNIVHSYPFCYRSETPLIYKTVPSWFIRVESQREKLLKNNAITEWVPNFVKEKRFHNWLESACDWGFSRNRYWGNPIPLWVSDDFEEVVCVGSIAELEELSGRTGITDLHREFVDDITIPSKMGKGELRRISEVFDCWFESGSMPYAQAHYPFENKEVFHESFPAQFCAEGLDQTRGWFYTLLVISSLVFDKPPFENLVVNGLILAADGKKMSKRLKNYTPPEETMKEFGADALRIYMVSSPVVRAETLKFKDQGVRDVIKDVLLPWYNAYRFCVQNIIRYEKDENCKFVFDLDAVMQSDNVMDKWLLSYYQSLVEFVHQEMEQYHLYTVAPRLIKFIEQLTNWYVRFNRKRLKGDTGAKDCRMALNTLFEVLFNTVKLMAPYAPFLTDNMYQQLCKVLKKPEVELTEGSDPCVHYTMIPKVSHSHLDKKIELAVKRMQAVIELGRVIRDRKALPLKFPLKEFVVIHKDADYLKDCESLQSYIKEEINVQTITWSSDEQKYGLTLRAVPDNRALGKRLGKAFKQVGGEIKKLTNEQLQDLRATGKITVCGHELDKEELQVISVFEKSAETEFYESHGDDDVLVLLDCRFDDDMKDEGTAREVINRVQKLRKKAGLSPTDNINVYYELQKDSSSANLQRVFENKKAAIDAVLKVPFKPNAECSSGAKVIIEEVQEISDALFNVKLTSA